MRRVLCAAIVAILAGPFLPAAASETQPRNGFDLRVVQAPSAAAIGGKTRLVYELRLTNLSSSPLVLKRLQVKDPDSGAILQDLSGDPLRATLGGDPAAPANSVLIAYLDVPAGGAAPRRLTHAIEVEGGSPGKAWTDAIESAAVTEGTRPLPVLGPPLRGGPWVAVYAPEMERGHRRVVYAVDGVARIPGRFAIDWMKVDPQGRVSQEGSNALAASYSHGAEVLAVADALVAATRDGMAESPAEPGRATTLGEAAGNYIALDLGDGRFAVYEHLKPGLKVRPGDRVKRGQVIASLGLTGQGSAPHLHFHVGDSPQPLAAEGLPYRLEGWTLLGAYASIEAFGRGGPWTSGPASSTDASLPGPNSVVRFPDEAAISQKDPARTP